MSAMLTPVAEIVHEALVAFWEGRITVTQAMTIKDLAKVHAMVAHRGGAVPFALPAIVIEPDDADLALLVREMGQEEWTPRDLRRLAVKQGLFRPWLTGEDNAAIHSRFGRLCENASGREFPDGVFLVRGSDRTRRYLIRPGAVACGDWSI